MISRSALLSGVETPGPSTPLWDKRRDADWAHRLVLTQLLSAARGTGDRCRPADGWTNIGRRHLGDRFGECDQVHALEMVYDVAADAGQMNRPCLLQPRQTCGREHRHLATAIALSPNPLNEPLA